jgi:hypothetical protein
MSADKVRDVLVLSKSTVDLFSSVACAYFFIIFVHYHACDCDLCDYSHLIRFDDGSYIGCY